MTAKDNRSPKTKPPMVQLPLFKAIEELQNNDMDVKITKKEPGRIRLAVDIMFREKVS